MHCYYHVALIFEAPGSHTWGHRKVVAEREKRTRKPGGIFDGFDPPRYSVRVRARPQKRQRQGRSSASGCSLTRSTPGATCAHAPKMTTGLLPREEASPRPVHSPPPFYFEQTDVSESALALDGGPTLPVGYPPPLRARQGAPGQGCTAAARRSPSLSRPRCQSGRAGKLAGRWTGGQAGPRSPLAAGKMWEFLSLGGEGSSPRLLPIPFFREQKDSHHLAPPGLAWVAAPPLASGTFGLAP